MLKVEVKSKILKCGGKYLCPFLRLHCALTLGVSSPQTHSCRLTDTSMGSLTHSVIKGTLKTLYQIHNLFIYQARGV